MRNNNQRVHVYVSGRVQGVYFRASTLAKAKNLSVVGFVRNTQDRRVEIVAEANTEILDQFISWCKQGPPGANVKDIRIQYESTTNEFSDFTIQY